MPGTPARATDAARFTGSQRVRLSCWAGAERGGPAARIRECRCRPGACGGRGCGVRNAWPCSRCETGSGCRSVGRAGWPGSIARPSATSPSSPTMTSRCERRCGGSRGSVRGGATGARIRCCSPTGGCSTSSAPVGCGARRGSGCRASVASASGWASPRCRPTGCGRSGPITCGRSTSSGIRPLTGTTSSCCTSSTSSPARRWRSSATAGSTPTRP